MNNDEYNVDKIHCYLLSKGFIRTFASKNKFHKDNLLAITSDRLLMLYHPGRNNMMFSTYPSVCKVFRMHFPINCLKTAPIIALIMQCRSFREVLIKLVEHKYTVSISDYEPDSIEYVDADIRIITESGAIITLCGVTTQELLISCRSLISVKNIGVTNILFYDQVWRTMLE